MAASFKADALILDFDGVLADSNKAHTEARLRAFDELGYAVDPALHEEAHSHGSNPNQIIGWILKKGGIVDVAADVFNDATVRHVVDLKNQIYFDETSLGLDAMPGAVELACWANLYFSRHSLAIATTAYKATEVNPYLIRHGLVNHFGFIAAREDTPDDALKPDPFVYRLAASAVKGSAAVAVEDSPRGLQSARAAGLFTVGITSSYPAEKLDLAHAIVDDLAQVPALIAA